MTLHFGVTDVHDYRHVTTAPQPCPHTGKQQWHPVTETLVWYSIPCGYSRIDQKNVDEVWRRVQVWQQAYPDTQVSRGEHRVPLTRGDVLAHVGLWTNASRKTPTEFNKFVVERLFQEDSHVRRDRALDVIGIWAEEAK